MSRAAVDVLPSRAVRFPSGDAACAGDLWMPAGASAAAPVPIVVLGHGLGATRAMGLAAYAERFAAAGHAALTFDYRSFGDSGGEPRQVIDVPSQREDWHSAVAFARTLPQVDPSRIVIWGSSFAGGHVIELAGHGIDVAGVIAQCPFTDGTASSLTLGLRSTVKIGALAAADLAASAIGRPPVLVAASGAPGSAALMTKPDALPGYEALVALAGPGVQTRVAARIGLRIGRLRPGAQLRHITVPTLVQVCGHDSVAPTKATLRHLRRAANPVVESQVYDYGHFEVYLGAPFEHLIADQLAFLARVLARAPTSAAQAA